MDNKNNYIIPALLVLICSGAVILRLAYGWERLLWLDEVQTVQNIRKGMDFILHLATDEEVTDIHPPLYYLVLYVWTHFLDSDLGMRFLSLIFGIGSLLLMYQLGKIVVNHTVGIVSSAIMAISVPHIIYSVEVRMYSLVLVLTLLLMISFLRWLEDQSRLWSIIYFLTAVASLYTYYYLAFLLLSLQVYVVSFHREKRVLLPWFGLHLGIAVLYMPWLVNLSYQLSYVSHDFWSIKPNPLQLPGLLFWFVLGPIWRGNFMLQLLVATTWLLPFGAGWFLLPVTRRIKVFLGLWFVLPPLIVFGLSQRTALFQSRYFLFITPVMYLLLGACLVHLWRTKLRYSLIFAFLVTGGLAIWLIETTPTQLDMKSVLETIARDDEPAKPVFHVSTGNISHETYIISRYYRPEKKREWIIGDITRTTKEVLPMIDEQDFLKRVADGLDDDQFLWLVLPRQFFARKNSDEIAQGTLPSDYAILRSYRFHLINLYYCGLIELPENFASGTDISSGN